MKLTSHSFFYLHVTREKLPKRLLYEKVARKMLMKLTPRLLIILPTFNAQVFFVRILLLINFGGNVTNVAIGTVT